MNFSHKIFLPWDLLEFIGDGILMPVYPGNKFSKIRVAQNLVAQRIPRSILLKL